MGWCKNLLPIKNILSIQQKVMLLFEVAIDGYNFRHNPKAKYMLCFI